MASADLPALLVTARLLAEADAQRIRTQAEATRRAVIHVLRESALVSDNRIFATLSEHLGLPRLNLTDDSQVDLEALRWLSQDVAEIYLVLPIGIDDRGEERVLRVAMADPLSAETILAVEQASGRTIDPLLAEASALQRAIERCYQQVTTRLIPRRDTRPVGNGFVGFRSGAAMVPETKPSHRLEDEATPAQQVEALLLLLEQRGLFERHEYLEVLKAVLRGESEG